MTANEAPEKIYIPRLISDGKLIHEWNDVPFKWFRFFFDKEIAENIEYTRTDVFIEKAAEFLYNYNQKQVLKHGARATLGCGEYTINVGEFRKYMKGE